MNIPIRGNGGWNFEAKRILGGVAFIRYHDGDREGSPVVYVPTDLYQAQDIVWEVSRAMRLYRGVNKRVIQLIVSIALTKKTEFLPKAASDL